MNIPSKELLSEELEEKAVKIQLSAVHIVIIVCFPSRKLLKKTSPVHFQLLTHNNPPSN